MVMSLKIDSISSKIITTILLILFLMVVFLFPSDLLAVEAEVLGIHVLSPHDHDYAIKLLKTESNQEKWHYVTIPLSLNDLDKKDEWVQFFQKCKRNKLIPIVRLTTKYENGSWKRPSRKEIVALFEFLNQLPWPTDRRYVIAFNEVNHAKEWGGQVDSLSYTQTLEFVANWAHTEVADYKVLPAAMDLAAPNSRETTEAFSYLTQMLNANPWIFDHVDYWNSHSYPNPAFSARPTNTGKNSIRGFEYELNFIKNKTGKEFRVFITETGWVDNRSTRPWLNNYYLYALQHVWSDSRVKGVTPFLLRGSPGPFESFSFFDDGGNPTAMFNAFQSGVLGVSQTRE